MLRSQPGPGPLLQAALDPLVASAASPARCPSSAPSFDGACLILALLVFAMTFPGGSLAAAGATARAPAPPAS